MIMFTYPTQWPDFVTQITDTTYLEIMSPLEFLNIFKKKGFAVK